jgi:hypothetical protein
MLKVVVKLCTIVINMAFVAIHMLVPRNKHHSFQRFSKELYLFFSHTQTFNLPVANCEAKLVSASMVVASNLADTILNSTVRVMSGANDIKSLHTCNPDRLPIT